MNAFGILFELFVRNQTTKTRLFMTGALAIGALLLAVLVNRNEASGDLIEAGSTLVVVYGSNLMVPLVALLLAGGVLGQLLQDETLVYLWLTPTSRVGTTLAAVTACATAGVVLVAVPLSIAALLATESSIVAIHTFIGSTLALFAYSAIFSLLGLITKNATIWGVVFIVLWETLLAIVTGPLSVTYHSRSIIAQQAIENDTGLGDLGLVTSPTTATISLVIMTIVFTAIAALRLNRMDVA